MTLLEKIRSIADRKWKINEGDEYGIPRDCPVKRAYKMQMRELMVKTLNIQLAAYIKEQAPVMSRMTPSEAQEFINQYIDQIEKVELHTAPANNPA